jgi:Meiotically up-regulated gene 113
MPQKSKGARLWLQPGRARRGGSQECAVWVIRDGAIKRSTGYPEHERQQAEIELESYLAGKPKARTYYLYFVSAKCEGFPIKIGITTTRELRFTALQCALPYDLEVLAMVEVEDAIAERKMHSAFASSRLRGEWFKRTSELLAAIDRLLAAQIGSKLSGPTASPQPNANGTRSTCASSTEIAELLDSTARAARAQR